MKKIFIVLLLLSCSISASYAASEDMSVYVRQDVFDARMDRLEAMNEKNLIRLEGMINALSEKVDGNFNALSERIDGNFKALSGRIDALSGRMDGFDYKIDVLQTVIYWGLGILSLLVGSFVLAPLFGSIAQKLRSPSLTVEDVKRLIAEAKLSGTQQV